MALAIPLLLVSQQGAQPAGARAGAARASAAFGKIKHVVVIFQENRSFDEVLGDWCKTTGRCDGYVGSVRLASGQTVPLTKSPDVITPDPPHTVAAQNAAIDGGKMDGWGYLGNGCVSPGTNNCLTYYAPSQIPSLIAYANKYVVSDHTFSLQDSPSWGGHMAVAAATQDGFTGDIPWFANTNKGWGCDADAVADWISPAGVKSDQPSCIPAPSGVLNPTKFPYRGAFQATQVPSVPTIFDRLDAAHRSWKLYNTIYDWSICPTFARCLYTSERKNLVATPQVLTDANAGTLPAYSIVLPSGPGGDTGQHPPSSMLVGDNWIGKVVNAIQAGPDWSSTAIFITYDDCGCFYDHVPPGVNPDGTKQGIREPMVIVSPYAQRGRTDSTPATFASILHFTEEAFDLAPLGINDAHAYDYAHAFDFTQPGTPPRVWPPPKPVPRATTNLVASLPQDTDDPT
ncbi:MAG TPA: alkaline phosphatase family protein [Acidimicrobiia bacterium]